MTDTQLTPSKKKKSASQPAGGMQDLLNAGSMVNLFLMLMLALFAVHCTWVTSNAYSSPSIVLATYNHDG